MSFLMLAALLAASPVPTRADESSVASPELIILEKTLAQKQDDKAKGVVTAEQHLSFLASFRPELAQTLERLPSSPANVATHSRILVLLGDHAAAIEELSRAVKASPDDIALSLAIGQTYYEKADYAGALATAEAVLKHDPKNDAALFLKHSSMGRFVPNAKIRTDNDAQTPSSRAARTDIVFTAPLKKKVASEIPLSSRDEPAPRDSKPLPLWPLLPVAGLGAGAYAVAKSRRTVESEEGFNADDRPQPGELQRFVAGSILSGLAAAALYLGGGYVLSVGAPLASRFMFGPGQQVLNLAQSEVGAINPGQVKAVSEVPKISARAIPLANEVPKMLVRVIPLKAGQGEPPMLGRAGDPHVFVTAAEDIAGIAPSQIAARLGITPAQRYLIVKFPAPNIGIRTPTQFDNPLFLGRGVTSGGAREFQVMNMRIPENAAKEIVEVDVMSR